jgi:ATP-dependent RNA helicase DHX57
MSETHKPEILRVPLEQLCLSIKAMGHSDIIEMLSKAIDCPKMENISRAIDTLKQMNALSPNGDLTALGSHMVIF